jgi:hypothetical protein
MTVATEANGQPCTKYFFPHVHYFGLCVPIAQQPGLCTGQAVVLGNLSLNACFYCTVAFPTFFTGSYCKSTEHIKKKKIPELEVTKKIWTTLSIGYFLRS